MAGILEQAEGCHLLLEVVAQRQAVDDVLRAGEGEIDAGRPVASIFLATSRRQVIQPQVAGPAYLDAARQHLVEDALDMLHAAPGGAELGVGEPDVLDAIDLFEGLDLLGHLDRITITLAAPSILL